MNNDEYWQSYVELEAQILRLSRSIDFDDANFDNGVHSVVIANLILQCAANIESISKDIFLQNNKVEIKRQKLYYDYDCILWMVDYWGLKKRIVNCKIASKCREDNYKYKPFDNLGKEKEWYGKKVPLWGWNEAYQDIKHDYIESISRSATLHNLVEMAAAFYMLILYYEDIIMYPTVQITGYWLDYRNTHLDTDLFLPTLFIPDKENESIYHECQCLLTLEAGDFTSNGCVVPQRLIMNKKK